MVAYRSREYAFQNPAVRWMLLGTAALCGALFFAGGMWASPEDAAVAWWVGAVVIAVVVLPLWTPLTVTVDDVAVRVSLAGVLKKAVHLEDITGADVRAYRPFRDFGGWGWKSSLTRPNAMSHTTRGSTAVVLTLHDGSEIYLGVDDESGLLDALAPSVGVNR